MSDLKLNEDGDLYFEKGQLVLFTEKSEATRQRLQIKIQTYLAEWFLNRTVGIPYFQVITLKGTPKVLVDSIFQEVIDNDPEVTSITTFESKLEQDTYTLNFEAEVLSGEIISIQQQITL